MEKLIKDINEGDIWVINGKHYRVDYIGHDIIYCINSNGEQCKFYKSSYQLKQNILAVGISAYNFSIGNY
jgi:hypothetical protein